MNEKQFDMNLRAAFVAPAMPAHMDHKINAAVEKLRNRKMVRRRFTLSLGASAAVIAGVVLFPAVKAQATLGGMMNALDKMTSGKALMFTVDENGKRWLTGMTIIANGNVETFDAKNRIKQVDIDQESFTYDSLANVYVRYPRRQNSGIRLSQMLGQAGSFSIGKRATVETVKKDGKEFLRAVVTNGGLPERYIIEADSKTQLPFHIQCESLELGNWRIRQVIQFDYQSGLTVSKPDFSKTPLVSKEELAARFNESITKSELGRHKANNGTLIVRAVDVAEDGSVFVAYQSGDRKQNSWSGYHLRLSDSLHTEYGRAGDLFTNMDVGPVPKDGKIELEVFVPVRPVNPEAKRTIAISIGVNDKGNIDPFRDGDGSEKGTNRINVSYPDGHIEVKHFPRQGGKIRFVKLLDKEFDRPTCGATPTWAGGIDWQLRNEVFAEIFKSGWRAKRAMEAKDWVLAEQCLNDNLHWMRESEQQGLSSWAQDTTLRDIEIVKTHLLPK